MFLIFVRPLTNRRALAITGCFLVALLSKEQGMLLPLLLLLLALCLGLRSKVQPRVIQTASESQLLNYANLSTTRRDESQRRAWLLLTLLLCWALAGYIVLRR